MSLLDRFKLDNQVAVVTGGGKGNNMLYLNGIESEKISSDEMISKVVKLVEEKAEEIEKN